MKKCRYLDEICLVYKRDFITPSFRQSHQHSALFHWVPNVNSCSVFIISTAGDSLNQSGSSSFHRPWTKSGITCSIRKNTSSTLVLWSIKKRVPHNQDHYLSSSQNKLDFIRFSSDEVKAVIQLHNLVC